MRYTSFFLVIVALLPGCSPKIVHYVNPRSQFKDLHTYWVVNYKMTDKEVSQNGRAIFSTLSTLIAEQMDKRGYSTDESSPDILVRYEFISSQVTEVNANNNWFYSPYGPYPNTYFSSRTFLESALLVEIINSESKKLVWQGSIDLQKYAKRNDTQKILREATQQLFNTYLYRSGSSTPDESLIEEI